MAFTSNELALVRLQSGDCGTNPLVTDDQINAVYEDTGSECATIVFIVRARYAAATSLTGVNRSSVEAVSNPAVPGIKEQLDYWQSLCPDAWPEWGQSTLDLGIDEELDTA